METLMSINNVKENQQQLAEQLFCAKTAYAALIKERRGDNNEENFTVVFNDIFQLVKGNSQKSFVERSRIIIKKINADLSLRKVYLGLVKQLTFSQSGLQAAASTGETLPERITEYFSLKFKRDKSNPRQVYVILTIEYPAEQHLINDFAVHMTNNNQVDCCYFPKISDGRSQLLMEDQDSRLLLLTDANSQLYLM